MTHDTILILNLIFTVLILLILILGYGRRV